ncbi:RCC1 and BTB domain-containing protein 1-like isoform X3 [Bacillus rossius redtenbacheri]|uniref:RCC1 and BTB domain-containing protein 1-like isoform X3 n=1 Tax=Bacillus rossius redtenbacheri TaxID=93214 RepID=UPI002FDEA170
MMHNFFLSSMELNKWNLFCLLEPEFAETIQTVCVFGNLGNEALIVTRSDDVYAIGCNAAGCLGLGDLQATLVPKKVEALCQKGVQGFAYGSGPHVVAFTSAGHMFSWGHNGYCELGNGTTNQLLVPSPVAAMSCKEVVDVSCGSHHSLALTRDGEVFAWGQNNCGQVGSGMSTNQIAPRKVNSALSGKRVISIACGQTSSMAVAENGEVYGWGYNGNGQLGIGNNVNQLNPCRVSGLQDKVVVKAACGYAHTLALTDAGELFAWGANSYGQLGTGNKSNVSSPVRIAADIGRIADIAATHYGHISAAITQNLKVYMWGQCRGQIVAVPTETPFTTMYDVFACFATPSVMWRPMRVNMEAGRKFADCFRTVFDDSGSSDLTIVVHGRPIYVHKLVLKVRCQYFRNMFQASWEENNKNVLEIDQYSYDVYRAFLLYLYTDEVCLTPEKALELLDLANAYCETHLKKTCEEIIKHGISIDNVAMLYATAITYQAKELEEFCFRYSLNHMTGIVQTESFALLDEQILKDFIVKAARSGVFKS